MANRSPTKRKVTVVRQPRPPILLIAEHDAAAVAGGHDARATLDSSEGPR